MAGKVADEGRKAAAEESKVDSSRSGGKERAVEGKVEEKKGDEAGPAAVESPRGRLLLPLMLLVFTGALFNMWFIPSSRSPRFYFPSQLAAFAGQTAGEPLLLAVLGDVFDVTEGARFYSPGKTYHFFTGKDASRAFVTGNFNEEGLLSDTSGLTPAQCLELDRWHTFFHTDYRYVARVRGGAFYDENGERKEMLTAFYDCLAQGKADAEKAAEDKLRYPPCNSRWSAASGGEVWCTRRSGGVQRDWVGVPRRMQRAREGSSKCVCLSPQLLADGVNDPQARFTVYAGCAPDSDRCAVVEDGQAKQAEEGASPSGEATPHDDEL